MTRWRWPSRQRCDNTDGLDGSELAGRLSARSRTCNDVGQANTIPAVAMRLIACRVLMQSQVMLRTLLPASGPLCGSATPSRARTTRRTRDWPMVPIPSKSCFACRMGCKQAAYVIQCEALVGKKGTTPQVCLLFHARRAERTHKGSQTSRATGEIRAGDMRRQESRCVHVGDGANRHFEERAADTRGAKQWCRGWALRTVVQRATAIQRVRLEWQDVDEIRARSALAENAHRPGWEGGGKCGDRCIKPLPIGSLNGSRHK